MGQLLQLQQSQRPMFFFLLLACYFAFLLLKELQVQFLIKLAIFVELEPSSLEWKWHAGAIDVLVVAFEGADEEFFNVKWFWWEETVDHFNRYLI